MFNARHDKERGLLIITASNDGRAELAAAYNDPKYGGYSRAEGVIAEGLHEAYEPWDADDAPDAWLCSAPFMIDCDGISYPDNGQRVVYAGTPVFYFPNYMVEDPWETLKNKGRVIWTQVFYDKPDLLSIEELKSYLPGGSREGQAVWIDPARFPPEATEESILKAWPELINEWEPDRLEVGLFFWKGGKRFGPYATSPRGVCDMERDGVVTPPKPPHPDNPTIHDLLEDWRGPHYERAAA
jgi:hypothetical protein